MKKAISLLLVLMTCLFLCGCGGKATPEMIDAYKNADACLSQGRYEDAARLYIEAGHYEDADQKLLEIYYYAVNCYENGNINDAYTLFVILNEANINNSAEYIALLEKHFCFVEAMENARCSFDEYDVFSGFEWLDKAATYATEQQQAEIDAFRQEISYVVYSNTQFVTFDAFLSKRVSRSQTAEGKYSYYSYHLSGHTYDDIHSNFKVHYDNNYTEINYDEIPKWIYGAIGKDYCFAYSDNSGNIIAWNFTKTYSGIDYTSMDVYIFYADFVESMSS